MAKQKYGGNRDDRKKLSWIYRRKAKIKRANRPQDYKDNENDNDKSRIIIRNLSFKATIEDVKKLYQPFGDIVDINFPKRTDGTPVGCCFVEFKRMQDASKAIFNTNKTEFLGRVINSSWAISKSRYCEKLKRDSEENVENVEDDGLEEEEREKPVKIKVETEESKQIKRERRKLTKEKNRKKRARIVVRNLSFDVTEENLKTYFSQYGPVESVNVLKRSDGKNVGCAFVQFELVQNAAKAVHYANSAMFLDRPMIVDFAMPKNQFSKRNEQTKNEETEVQVKVEKESDTEDDPAAENATKSNSNEESGSDKEDEGESEDESDDEEKPDISVISDDKNESVEEEPSDEDDEETREKEDAGKKRPRFESHDVSEGKTVFLKNVPFSVKNDQLKTFMERFGPVYYALVCIDPLTEFSKGTAFVKFKNVEDAKKCLTAGKDLEIDDQVMEAQKALDRNEIENKANTKQTKQKDNRNLYLVKEGVIMAGSPAANGVSAADMAKRLQIEQWKSQILRNLNMFVSRIRLVIHNLPATMDDAKLRKIVERYGPPGAIIREARVMRDMRNVDIKGVGKSKEYGFVSFTKHEDALQALRNINNNPNIFTPKRRPIVSFSIENRVMVNARQKRIQKSRENNPTWPGNKAKRKDVPEKEEEPKKRFKHDESINAERKESDKKSFEGTASKPGESKMRSKFKLKKQAVTHRETVKKEKKMKKSIKKLQEKRKNRMQNRKEVKPKQRVKVKASEVQLDKLVNNYKNKLQSIDLKKSKWYES